jgi:hypothetical protein
MLKVEDLGLIAREPYRRAYWGSRNYGLSQSTFTRPSRLRLGRRGSGPPLCTAFRVRSRNRASLVQPLPPLFRDSQLLAISGAIAGVAALLERRVGFIRRAAVVEVDAYMAGPFGICHDAIAFRVRVTARKSSFGGTEQRAGRRRGSGHNVLPLFVEIQSTWPVSTHPLLHPLSKPTATKPTRSLANASPRFMYDSSLAGCEIALLKRAESGLQRCRGRGP